jgi:polar amino acid transport system substrate-binding protein
VRNSIYEQFVETIGFSDGKNLLKVSHSYECLNLFFKNKIELIIGSDLSFDYQLTQYGHPGREVVKLVELPLNDTLGNYLALNKNIPIDVVERLQSSYEKLIAQGKLDFFIEQYSNTNSK